VATFWQLFNIKIFISWQIFLSKKEENFVEFSLLQNISHKITKNLPQKFFFASPTWQVLKDNKITSMNPLLGTHSPRPFFRAVPQKNTA
jgi:hypothetical protein